MRVYEKPSQASQGKNKQLKKRKKSAPRVGQQGSPALASPRKGLRGTLEQAVLNDDQGWRTVRRVVDTIELLRRRHLIDARQCRAAGRYRDAVEACSGSIPSPLDADHVRNASAVPSPTERHLWGASMLRGATGVLGRIDGALVMLVAAEGRTIEEAAGMMFARDGKLSERDVRHAGRRLREALTVLADLWWPERPAC